MYTLGPAVALAVLASSAALADAGLPALTRELSGVRFTLTARLLAGRGRPAFLAFQLKTEAVEAGRRLALETVSFEQRVRVGAAPGTLRRVVVNIQVPHSDCTVRLAAFELDVTLRGVPSIRIEAPSENNTVYR